MSVKIIIADDQKLMREGLNELLGGYNDIEVVALAADGEEAYDLICKYKPDVSVIDVRMPKVSGIELLKKLNSSQLDCPILLLTTFSDEKSMLEGLYLGAKGYLLKDTSPERLSEAIKLLACGKSYILPTITDRIVNGVINSHKPVDNEYIVEKLTVRESEIIRLVGSGLNNKMIGKALACSQGTVRNHMSTIISKLGVKDRTQALLKAIDLGFI